MLIKFPSAQERLGLIQHLRGLAREPWYPEEVDDTRLVKLDRERARIQAHTRRADQAYAAFATLPRVA
jgi:hypothetical protein